MRIIFMGTPFFAVPILEKLIEQHDVCLVVTQPDQLNRKKQTVPIPVKECALQHDIPVFQPKNIRKEVDRILAEEVDLIVTAAYGQWIPNSILNHPKHRSINVHGSLLPKYRGGAPIQRAIMNGDRTTGISIIYMESKMDAGDILMKREVPIEEQDTQQTVFDKLSILGAEMILEVIHQLEKGITMPQKQDEALATYAYNLTKEDEQVKFSNCARKIHNQIRGMYPNPGCYFLIEGKTYKVSKSRVNTYQHQEAHGTILAIEKDCFDVACGNHSVLSIIEIQPESKKMMSVRDFLNGSGKHIIAKGKQIIQGDEQ
jgi:methionyl-tRNA formyltransferase